MRNKTGFVYTLIWVAIIILLSTVSCKKEDKAEKKQQQTTTEQDLNLLGAWAQDSSQMDGSIMIPAMEPDSLIITTAMFKKISYWNYGTSYESKVTTTDQWETKGDSIFLNQQGVEGNHYQYFVTDSTLMIYLNAQSNNDVKYFFHR